MESPLTCPSCGRPADLPPACCPAPRHPAGWLDLLPGGPTDPAGRAVAAFYEEAPFPGYGPDETAETLLERARAVPFLRALDAAVPVDARVLDLGCGTGQVAALLALRGRRRQVLGVDLTPASLGEAQRFRDRVGLTNLSLVRADLFGPVLADQAFDVVISRGVAHHTADPDRALRRIADRVAPGGVLVFGYYDRAARQIHRLRVAWSRATGAPPAWADPVLRHRDLADEKRRAWIRDQYLHPVEHLLGLGRVIAGIEAAGLRFVRTVPPLGDDLLARSPRPGPVARAARGFGWLAAGLSDPDAGLVAVVADRPHRT